LAPPESEASSLAPCASASFRRGTGSPLERDERGPAAMSAQTVLLFGPPGAGKGTQAKLLKDRMSVPHISTGDMFRDHLGRRTDLGLKVEKILNDGPLVPDAVTNEMVRDRLLRPDTSLGVILDGYPRSVPQARWLDSFLEARGFGVRAVVVID